MTYRSGAVKADYNSKARSSTGAARAISGSSSGLPKSSGISSSVADARRRAQTRGRSPARTTLVGQQKVKTQNVSLGSLDAERAAAVSTNVGKKKIKPKVLTVNVPAIKFPLATILVSALAALSFMLLILNYVTLNEITTGLTYKQKKLNGLITTEKELSVLLEKKNDLRLIEEYATEKLGMVKKDQVEKQYVRLGNEDRIETPGSEQSDASDESFFERIAGFFEYYSGE